MQLPHTSRLLAALVVAGMLSSVDAAPIASKASEAGTVTTDSAREEIRSLLAREDVARVLARHGLTPEEAEARLDRLTTEDLAALAANPDQIQSAGNVPNYIWVLLAILIGVTILATVF